MNTASGGPSRVAEGRRIQPMPTPLPLEFGGALENWHLAYESWGVLNADRSNAVLVCHALTSDCHVTGNGVAGLRPGWWETMVGPGLPIDTDRMFVVCINVLGGCDGSSGPAAIDAATLRPYGMRFPLISLRDMVRAQAMLLDLLGIDRLHTVIGGCLGGFQALVWGMEFPERARHFAAISARIAYSGYGIALWAVVRRAIMLDANWNGGDYYGGTPPAEGLGLSTAIGLLHWMEPPLMDSRYGRRRKGTSTPSMAADFEVDHLVEGVAGRAAGKFDANTLIYLTRAMDYFDQSEVFTARPGAFLAGSRAMIANYERDVRYPPQAGAELAEALRRAGAEVAFLQRCSDIVHGGFLLDPLSIADDVRAFLDHDPPVPGAAVQRRAAS